MKSTDTTLLTKVRTVKAVVFPVLMYDCEDWTIKKSEHWRIDALELWWWRRLLRVPWAARWSNQSILREINPEYSLEGVMMKLKLQYFGHLMWTANSLETSLMLGKIEGRRRRGHQRMRWLDGITSVMDINLGKLWGMVRDREAWHAAVCGIAESDGTDWLHKNTLKYTCSIFYSICQRIIFWCVQKKSSFCFIKWKFLFLGIGTLNSSHSGAESKTDEHKVGHTFGSSYELELYGNNSIIHLV